MYLNWPVRRAEVRRKLATSVLFCSLLSLLWRKFYTQVFFWLSFFLICFVLRIKEQEFLTKRKNHQLNQGRKKQCKHSWKWTINSFSNPESIHNNKNLNKVHFVQNNKVSLRCSNNCSYKTNKKDLVIKTEVYECFCLCTLWISTFWIIGWLNLKNN